MEKKREMERTMRSESHLLLLERDGARLEWLPVSKLVGCTAQKLKLAWTPVHSPSQRCVS
jgi:hypothetical protein